MANDDQPMYAEISHEGETFSKVQLVLFDKKLERTFKLQNHREMARNFVLEWNLHLEEEWHKVRQSSGAIMQSFHAALVARGVPEETLADALGDMVNHVQK